MFYKSSYSMNAISKTTTFRFQCSSMFIHVHPCPPSMFIHVLHFHPCSSMFHSLKTPMFIHCPPIFHGFFPTVLVVFHAPRWPLPPLFPPAEALQAPQSPALRAQPGLATVAEGNVWRWTVLKHRSNGSIKRMIGFKRYTNEHDRF